MSALKTVLESPNFSTNFPSYPIQSSRIKRSVGIFYMTSFQLENTVFHLQRTAARMIVMEGLVCGGSMNLPKMKEASGSAKCWLRKKYSSITEDAPTITSKWNWVGQNVSYNLLCFILLYCARNIMYSVTEDCVLFLRHGGGAIVFSWLLASSTFYW